MAQNFIESRREQGFLLPPDVREWLAADHLAWFVIDAVGEMDLSAFYGAYRADGHGRAAYEPSMMVALILYAFASNVRSSRAIECHCRQDVAYRVITGNLVPDHATIARFVCRHERALADLFAEVLKLCDRAGLVKPGVVSLDGTRIAGNASPEVNYEFEQIAREILAEARATDEAEDEAFGEARGDELPEQLRSAEGRREFFRQAREQMRGEEVSPEVAGEPEADRTDEVSLGLDANEIVGRGRQGRDAWLREGKRQLEQHRWKNPDPIPRSRGERLLCRPSGLRQIWMSSAATRTRPLVHLERIRPRPPSGLHRPLPWHRRRGRRLASSRLTAMICLASLSSSSVRNVLDAVIRVRPVAPALGEALACAAPRAAARRRSCRA